MQLKELKKGEEATIIKIDAPSDLKNRFLSFGMIPGERVKVKECSIGKHTIEVQIGNLFVALRKKEAEKILVEKLKKEEKCDQN